MEAKTPKTPREMRPLNEAVATLRKYGERRVADALEAASSHLAEVAQAGAGVRNAQAKYWAGDKSAKHRAAMKLAEARLDEALRALLA
jgi:hypothetical protein